MKIICRIPEAAAHEFGLDVHNLKRERRLVWEYSPEKCQEALVNAGEYLTLEDNGRTIVAVKKENCFVFDGNASELIKLSCDKWPDCAVHIWKSEHNPGYYEMEV